LLSYLQNLVLNRSAISVSAVYQQKLDQLSDQLSSAD